MLAVPLLAAVLASGLGCRPGVPPVAGPEKVELEGQRGYVSRPCGFDLDDDGRVGEPEDCRVCDGRTTDPDGDGVEEILVYVDCDSGEDSPGCGEPSRPCASLSHAWELAAAAGRGDASPRAGDAEPIVCFRGTCRPERLTPPVAGSRGVRVEPASGSADRDFELPTDPAMLVGWDGDGDGAYPPYDPDDHAVLDGAPAAGKAQGLSQPFVLGSANSRFEMAHFSVVDYGRHTTEERSGFVHFHERGGLRADHLYFHDLSLRSINRERAAQGHRIVFNFFTGGTNFHHLLFRNLEILDTSGFMVRGSGPDRPGTEAEGGNDGPYRWQNLTVTADGCDHSDSLCRERGGSAFLGWKLWGWIDGVEILDSFFDANVAAWEPKPTGNGGAQLVNATQCSRGWTVRNNFVKDFKVAFEAQGGDGAYCAHGEAAEGVTPSRVPRPTGDVVFDRNVVWNTYVPWRQGDYLVHLVGGDDLHRTLDTATISQNVLASSDGYDACIRIEVGHAGDPHAGEQPGWIHVYGNTCWGARAEGRSTGIEVTLSRKASTYPQHRIWLRNNLVAGAKEGDYALRLRYRPEQLILAGNLASPAARFALGRTRAGDAEGFLELLGLEHGVVDCEPRFVDPEAGDFRLHPEDTCARDAGANLSFWATTDLDGDPRPEGGPWDAGADQIPPR
ncbi:MAG: hypothetical protein MI919_34395 [Holophagales bacterium]|nr:hypothetical protein [Holophagales bacterium]